MIKARLPTEKGFAEALNSATKLLKKNSLSEADVFTNATGIGARALADDKDVYPTKGQTVLVKGEAKYAKTMDENTYVIPRPGSGTTILGGTREVGNW